MNTVTGVGANPRYASVAVPKTGTASFNDSLNTSLRAVSSSQQHAYYKTLPFEQVGDAMARDAELMLQRIKGAMQVPIGRNELPEFLAEMEKALANGASLQSVLQKQINKHTADDGSRPGSWDSNGVDLFFIDPNTGEIKDACSSVRSSYVNMPSGGMSEDDDFVWDLAFDLHEFIKLRFFKNEGDDSDEVGRLIDEIKARQVNKNYDRFDNPIR